MMDAGNNVIAELAQPEELAKMSAENQRAILDAITRKEEREGGIMGRIFGTNKENASMYVALTLCVLVAVIGLIVWAVSRDMQIWSVILPTITTMIGFIFGRGTSGE